MATPTVKLSIDSGAQGDGMTNNADLQFSSAASGVTRRIAINGGDASDSYTAPVTDGKYTVVVTDTDSKGESKSASISFTLDRTLDMPTVALTNDTGSSDTDKITRDAALTFSTAAADVTRTFKINGGAATSSYTAPTTSGDYTVEVIDTDAAGNTKSASISFTLDVSLDTPTVRLATDGGASGDGLTNDPALQVSAAAADVARTFSINGGPANATYTPTTDGDYTVVVTDTDAAGNTKSASISFALDRTLDTPTIALTNDTGSSDTDKITQDAALMFSTAAADVTRTFKINGATATSSYTAPTTSGDYTVEVIDTDAAGNTKSASITFTLDVSLDTPTVQLQADGGAQGDGLTNNAALQISAAAADVTRTFSINGGEATSTYTAPAVDGEYTVLVTDTDTAGNVKSQTFEFELDATLAMPTVALTNDTGSDDTDKITRDAALTFSTASADVTRTFKINGGAATSSYTAPTTSGDYTVEVIDTDAAGNTKSASIAFTFDVSLDTPTVELQADGGAQGDGLTNNAALKVSAAAADVTRTFSINGGEATSTYTAPTTDGDYTVVVTDTDTAGNVTSQTIEFELDATLAMPTVALTNDTGSDDTDKITQDFSLDLSQAAADVTRTFSVNGAEASSVYVLPTQDGDYTVVVTDTDAAGNSKSATIEFTFDTSVDLPTIGLVDDSGDMDNDNLTNNAALQISAAAADVTRTFSINGGTATSNYTAPTADGEYTVLVTDTDTAGNVTTQTIEFELDTTLDAPTVTLTNDTGSSDTDKITRDAALTFSAAAPDVVRMFSINGGARSISYVEPTTSGEYTVEVIDTDAAGNTKSASITFEFDVTIATPAFDPTKVNWSTVKLDGTDDFRPALNQGIAADVERFVYVFNQATPTVIDQEVPVDQFSTVSGGGSYLVLGDRDLAGNTAVSEALAVGKLIPGESIVVDLVDGIALGTESDDDLAGDVGAQYLVGGLGDDSITSGGGNDNLFGGAGHDILKHDASGSAFLSGGAGDDYIETSFVATIDGGDGNDQIFLMGMASTLLREADGGSGVDLFQFDSEITMLQLGNKVSNMEIFFYSGSSAIDVDISAVSLDKMAGLNGLSQLIVSPNNTLKSTHKQALLLGENATYIWDGNWTKEQGTVSMDLSIYNVQDPVENLSVYTHNTLALQFII